MENNLSSNEDKNKESSILNSPVINLVALLDQTNDIIYRAQELEIKIHRITLSQVKVMTILLKGDVKKGVSLADLSKLMLREPNSITTLIQRMAKAELIKKRRDKKENKIFVTITVKGRNLMINKVTGESLRVIVSALNEREMQNLRICLNKLREKGRQVLGLDLKPPILR
ncbi:MAG: hypothetical protein JW967_01290 [Dehalococcoidales bacterium]|nr:hypothetical protein [Dehalococcoidales bacterium]